MWACRRAGTRSVRDASPQASWSRRRLYLQGPAIWSVVFFIAAAVRGKAWPGQRPVEWRAMACIAGAVTNAAFETAPGPVPGVVARYDTGQALKPPATVPAETTPLGSGTEIRRTHWTMRLGWMPLRRDIESDQSEAVPGRRLRRHSTSRLSAPLDTAHLAVQFLFAPHGSTAIEPGTGPLPDSRPCKRRTSEKHPGCRMPRGIVAGALRTPEENAS